MSLFVNPEDLRRLTGFATKAKQIAYLRTIGIPFIINGAGKPVVTVAAVEGRRETRAVTQAWSPAVLQGERKAA